mmetsp:Transcript_83021/g.216423  ORF Transcript_83021/g.216423 Transcript_83021/m.216423 type:complete len:228 (-) Transcript_83021:61-744(-)
MRHAQSRVRAESKARGDAFKKDWRTQPHDIVAFVRGARRLQADDAPMCASGGARIEAHHGLVVREGLALDPLVIREQVERPLMQLRPSTQADGLPIMKDAIAWEAIVVANARDNEHVARASHEQCACGKRVPRRRCTRGVLNLHFVRDICLQQATSACVPKHQRVPHVNEAIRSVCRRHFLQCVPHLIRSAAQQHAVLLLVEVFLEPPLLDLDIVRPRRPELGEGHL